MKQNELNTITSEIVERVTNLLADKTYKIIMYGSCARGDNTEESDVDIMVLLDCDKTEVCSYRKDISRLSSRIALDRDMEVSILLRDRDSFEKGIQILPFYRNIESEGIILYG